MYILLFTVVRQLLALAINNHESVNEIKDTLKFKLALLIIMSVSFVYTYMLLIMF